MNSIKKNVLIVLLSLMLTNLLPANTANILYFNDFHGQVDSTKSTPGMIKLVSFVDSFRKKHPHTLVVSGGDNYQGSILANLTHGAIVNKMFKLMGVKYSAVGNHEFDWGIKYFPKWQKNGIFTYLAANIFNRETGKPVSWAKPYSTVTVNNLKIAFIGLATEDTVNTTLHSNIKNLIFKSPAKCAQKWIDYLKSGKSREGKPDIIIALTHIPSEMNSKNGKLTGAEIHNLVNNTKGLNAVFSAHSHKDVIGYINKIPVIQAGCHGIKIIDFKIEYKYESGIIKDININPIFINMLTQGKIPLNKEAAEVYNFYKSKLKYMTDKVIGSSKSEIKNSAPKYHLTPIGSLICKIIQDSTKVQVAMLNQWGFRDKLNKGKITYGNLYNILPFNNTIVTLQVTGKDLKQQIEHGITLQGGAFFGVNATYDLSKPEGSRITQICLSDGKTVLDNNYYSLAINNFMFSGGDNYSFKNARNIKDTGLNIRDIVLKYIGKHKDISPTATNYLKIVK